MRAKDIGGRRAAPLARQVRAGPRGPAGGPARGRPALKRSAVGAQTGARPAGRTRLVGAARPSATAAAGALWLGRASGPPMRLGGGGGPRASGRRATSSRARLSARAIGPAGGARLSGADDATVSQAGGRPRLCPCARALCVRAPVAQAPGVRRVKATRARRRACAPGRPPACRIKRRQAA